jgi:MoxR-like ATPase
MNSSLYEWNYPKQLLQIRLEEQCERDKDEIEKIIYSPEFLIKRPLLEAIWRPKENSTVLLIDEIDRSDEEFEAFLLEILSDFQVTIPEIGTLAAKTKPLVVITSNRTRDIHDALKRRCLYHWIEYPNFDKEYRIVTTRIPHIENRFAEQITLFMQKIRTIDLLKKPGISETLDWAQALITMHRDHLNEDVVLETLGCILKYHEDLKKFKEEIWADHDQRVAFL